MNRDCNGDYVQDAKLYRCLRDSTICEVDGLPEICPNCEREVSAVIHPTAIRHRRVNEEIVIDGVEFIVSSRVENVRHGT